MKTLPRLFYEHLILPFQASRAPLAEVRRGAVVGMFIGLSPTMGIQMYLAALVWVVARYLLGLRFNLPIAIALVWITNPVTVVPMYYGYLVSGHWLMELVDLQPVAMGYAEFSAIIQGFRNNPDIAWQQKLLRGGVFLFWEFGWPILVGSMLWAVPLAVLAYPFTHFFLRRYRVRLAAGEGLSYREWVRRYVHPEPAPPLDAIEPPPRPET